MKKYLILLGVVAGVLTSGVASAKLVDYYHAKGQNLPSVSERKASADSCGIYNYEGSKLQNIALEDCLANVSHETLVGGLVTKPYTYSPSTVISSAQVNANFDTLYNLVNGNIDNDNIKSGAAISASKISGTAVVTTPSASQTITNAGAAFSTIIKGVSGQTANIFDVQNASSTSLLSVKTDGVDASSSLYFTTSSIRIYPNLSNGKLTFVDQTDGPYTLSQLAALSAFANGTAIDIVSNTISVLVSSTTGMATDTANRLYQKINTDTGLEYGAGSTGIHLNTSTLVGLIATSTVTANKIPIWQSNGQLNVSSSPSASTDASSKNYVDTQNLKLLSVYPSDTLQQSADTERTKTNDTNYTLVKEIRTLMTGQHRIKFDLRSGVGDAADVFARIYKNGVAYGTERQTGEVYTTYSEDLYFAPNDLIQLYYKTQSGAGLDVYVRNFRVYYDKALTSTESIVNTN